MKTRDHDVRAILRRLHGRAEGVVPKGPDADRLSALWRELPDPGPLAPPAGFSRSVLRRLDRDDVPQGLAALFAAPSPVRALAALGLAAGVVVGVGVGTLVPLQAAQGEVVESTSEEWVVGTTLAESWLSFSEEEGS